MGKGLRLEFDGMDNVMRKINVMGSGKAKTAAESALKKSGDYISEKLDTKTVQPNMPRKGVYSKGRAKAAIIKNAPVQWVGALGEMEVGFKIRHALHSIFLMYGTPKMKPMTGLRAVIYGSASKRDIAQIQEQEFLKELTK